MEQRNVDVVSCSPSRLRSRIHVALASVCLILGMMARGAGFPSQHEGTVSASNDWRPNLDTIFDTSAVPQPDSSNRTGRSSSGGAISSIKKPVADMSQILHPWEFENGGCGPVMEYGYVTTLEDGLLRGEVTGADAAFMIFGECSVPTPLRVRMRVKTCDNVFGRGEIYWITEQDSRWAMDKFVRFPMQHDHQWREIDVPIPAVGQVTAVRVSVGWKSGVFAMDWIRLEQDPFPSDVLKRRKALPRRQQIEDDVLSVLLKPHEHRFSIKDKRTGRSWTLEAQAERSILLAVDRLNATQLKLSLYDHPGRRLYDCLVSLSQPGTLAFTLDTSESDAPFYSLNQYPPALRTDMGKGKLLFCDRSAGVYLDQRDETYGGRLLGIYGNTTCTDMPFIGLIDELKEDGVIALAETPADAYFYLAPDDEGRHWPQIHWEESLDTFRYARSLSYRFSPEGGYVNLAQIYREYAEQQGRVVPLEDKRARKPAVSFLKGAPIIWGAYDAWEFVREARTLGLTRGVLCNTLHGLFDSSAVRELNAMGYLTAPYDSFGDVLDGDTGFHSDNIEETALHVRPGLGPALGWQDELNTYFTRSSAYALRALKSYVPSDIETLGYNSRFIDVSMAIHLMEDWHPDHTFDRRQDLAYRRECFAWLDGLDLVLGIEHGNDWGIEFIEWTEGAVGGPFWWEASHENGWNPSRLRRAEAPGDYPENYLKYGDRHDTRVPLWQLVYHDCNVSTWYWGDGPGFHYHADPRSADRKDLFTLLYGGVPVLWRDRTGYDWFEHRDRFMRSYYDTCIFHEEVAFARMTDHRFLSEDSALQRTWFDTGHSAVVNFSDHPRSHSRDNGETVLIAPLGYWVEGPGFHQSRVWVDGESVTRIEKDGWRVYDTPSWRKMGPLEGAGHVVAFRVDDGLWQLALEKGREYVLDVAGLTGWPAEAPCALMTLDEKGGRRWIAPVERADVAVSICADSKDRFFALQKDPGNLLVAYPSSGYLDEHARVILSTAAPGAVIRYALNNTPLASDSAVCDGVLSLPGSGALVAGAFVDGKLAGEPVRRLYRVSRDLFQSDLMRGGDEAIHVDCLLDGCSRLRLVVGNAEDDCWSDWANFGGAAFVMESGERMYLSDLEPAWAKQTYHEPGRDQNPLDGAPLVIARRSFQKGLACHSVADLLFDIPTDALRFEAWVGVDDRANPEPGAPEVLRGTVTFTVQGILPGCHLTESVGCVPHVTGMDMGLEKTSLPGRKETLR